MSKMSVVKLKKYKVGKILFAYNLYNRLRNVFATNLGCLFTFSIKVKSSVGTNSVPQMTPVCNGVIKILMHIYLQIHRLCWRCCRSDVKQISCFYGLFAPEMPGTKPQRENFYCGAAGASIPTTKATSLT